MSIVKLSFSEETLQMASPEVLTFLVLHLEAEGSRLQVSLDDSEARLEAEERKVRELNEEIERLVELNVQLGSHNDALEQLNIQLDSQNDELRLECQTLHKMDDEMHEALVANDQLETDYDELQHENEALRVQLYGRLTGR